VGNSVAQFAAYLVFHLLLRRVSHVLEGTAMKTNVGFRDGFLIGSVIAALIFALGAVFLMFVKWDFEVTAFGIRLWLAVSLFGGLFGGIMGLFE
jgi:hypothetical protein